MLGYILRRLLQVIPVFFGATLLIYFMVFACPETRSSLCSATRPRTPPSSRSCGAVPPRSAVLRAVLLLHHRHLPGNLGVTFSGQSVNDVLARTLPVTGRLAVMAIAIEFTLAIIIGTISALRKGKLFDNTCS
jgi:oligopeptide transport system permease protein